MAKLEASARAARVEATALAGRLGLTQSVLERCTADCQAAQAALATLELASEQRGALTARHLLEQLALQVGVRCVAGYSQHPNLLCTAALHCRIVHGALLPQSF